MTKSKAAFLLSVRTLFRQKLPNGKEQARRVYFWTFTFRTVVDDEQAFRSWKHLNTLLCRRWKSDSGIPGVRVVEVHPGGHGLHFHLLIARRVDVNEVRRYAIRAGFGRIHVRKAGQNDAEYMAKYLAKQEDGLRKGCRRWGNFGSFKGTRVKDIVVESTLAENCRRVRAVVKNWGRGTFIEVYRLTAKYGHVLDWPTYPSLSEPLDRRMLCSKARARSVTRYERSDNDCPDVPISPRPLFTTIKLYCAEIGEYVTHLIPRAVDQPF